MTDAIAELRQRHYNARVVDQHRVHDELMILRIEADHGPLQFTAGQYTTLGLGYWEPRVPGCQDEELSPEQNTQLIKRAYSMSCGLLNESNAVVLATEGRGVEFYISLVRRAASRPPALTPRLFHLDVGDRLFMGLHAHGHYGLGSISSAGNVIFVATGTGEAPHNAMLAELLRRGHRGRIVSVNCVRCRRDLAYLDKHRELERQFSHYRYLTLTTREPENLDSKHPNYVGKRYHQDYFDSGDFEWDAGLTLDPVNTHVFLCGAPEMIGVPRQTHDPQQRFSGPRGMIEVLEARGFRIDLPHEPENIHFEKYW